MGEPPRGIAVPTLPCTARQCHPEWLVRATNRCLSRLLALLVGALAGCSALSPALPTVTTRPAPKQPTLGAPVGLGDIRPIAHQLPPPDGATPPATEPLPAPWPLPPELAELSAEAVVGQVLARNPSLAQMVAAWQAAQARYPQVTSLDDPMFAVWAAPGAWGSNEVRGGYRIEASQKLPFCGKLALRGDSALAEASAAGHDVSDMRLQLAEAARTAFYDYYLAERGLEVNAEGLDLLRKFKQNAETRYKTGLVPQQDILQADVEIGRAQERRLGLEQMRKVAIARINTLMHLPPDAALPPVPKDVALPEPVPDAAALRASALSRRPDLAAIAERIRAEEAALGLAHKEFYPDVELMAAYDTFWQERPLQWQGGVRLNLPVYRDRRRAQVAEAEAKLAQRRAELARQADQVNYQVQEAFEKARQGEQSVALYAKTILPAAKANVEAAQAAYVTGKIPFLSLIEAQRNQVGLRDRYYETVADYFRRRATLERVIGGPLPTPPAHERTESEARHGW
jgi:outer membrane protein, heavy metal efflux system